MSVKHKYIFCDFITGSLFMIALLGFTASVHAEKKSYNLQSGPLIEVLDSFAEQSGAYFFIEESMYQNVQSLGLTGEYDSNLEALNQLLSNTGLQAIEQIDGSFLIDTPKSELQLETVVVTGNNADQDASGYFDQYDLDQSTAFIGKAEIERFKGKDAADMFKGMLNIYSGDSRNGGGIDPNIRGIQGPGRVPVSVDDTEQAVTIWRGYRGVSNRNYIDPNLIGRVKVIKGPAIDPNHHTSSGGGVMMRTIDATDVVPKGNTFGAEIVLETSNNATNPRLPTLATGMHYQALGIKSPNNIQFDPTLMKSMYKKGDENPFSVDTSYRIGVGMVKPKYELLAAYASRYRGNYFSGQNNASFYKQDKGRNKFNSGEIKSTSLAWRQRPGFEVPNTSSLNKSWLLKGKYKPAAGHILNLGFRHTRSEYGEIMASRAGALIEGKLAQWPLSKVRTVAYNLGYKYQPKNNSYLNVKTTLWYTNTKSDTYSSGGAPNFANSEQEIAMANLGNFPDFKMFKFSPILRNTAIADNQEHRIGVSLSNTARLNERIQLTGFARLYYHKLSSNDKYPEFYDWFRQKPRAGRRQESELGISTTYQPNSKLRLNAGIKYGSYWLFDDFLNERIKANDLFFNKKRTNAGVYLTYKIDTDYTASERAANKVKAEDALLAFNAGCTLRPQSPNCQGNAKQAKIDEINALKNAKSRPVAIFDQPWYHHNGYYSRANNPCIAAIKKYGDRYIKGTCKGQGLKSSNPKQQNSEYIKNTTTIDQVNKVRDKAFIPAIGVRYQFNDAYRVYARYTEAVRFPSMFEGTVGFSANQNSYSNLEAEHTYNYELGAVYSFKIGDIRLSYFRHKTKNVIERIGDGGGFEYLAFFNVDSQTLDGIELQNRIDTGRFFSNLSIAYNFSNEVCDENMFARANIEDVSGSNCRQAGFDGGYLKVQSIPEYSGNLTFGGRFFTRSLESGIRLVHSAGQSEKAAVKRNQTTTVDWYNNYRYSKHLGFEMVITNALDEYYIDALARSDVPAPGRTIKLKATAKF